MEWCKWVKEGMGLGGVGTISEVFSFELLGCEWRREDTTVARMGCEFNKGLLEVVGEVVVVLFFFGLVW